MGLRQRASQPGNTTPLASPSFEGIGEAMAFEGVATEAVCEVYVEQVLAPSLRAGRVVVMDNLRAHKGNRVKELIEARGADLVFLLAYPPDFSPIEEVFSKIKRFQDKGAPLKKAAARTREALIEAIG